jgi:hypothetical protein
MFISKLFLLIFFSGANNKFYYRVEKTSQKVCGGKLKLDQFWGAGDVCHYVKFWGRIRRTCFPAKKCLFNEIRKLKEEEEE